MKIENHELALLQDRLDREGKKEEAAAVKQQFLQMIREGGDHCPCKVSCELHGDCFACVQVHRGHRRSEEHTSELQTASCGKQGLRRDSAVFLPGPSAKRGA